MEADHFSRSEQTWQRTTLLIWYEHTDTHIGGGKNWTNRRYARPFDGSMMRRKLNWDWSWLVTIIILIISSLSRSNSAARHNQVTRRVVLACGEERVQLCTISLNNCSYSGVVGGKDYMSPMDMGNDDDTSDDELVKGLKCWGHLEKSHNWHSSLFNLWWTIIIPYRMGGNLYNRSTVFVPWTPSAGDFCLH